MPIRQGSFYPNNEQKARLLIHIKAGSYINFNIFSLQIFPYKYSEITES